jgi:hypothetical protein
MKELKRWLDQRKFKRLIRRMGTEGLTEEEWAFVLPILRGGEK